MQGNILITVLMVLTALCLSTLYTARESLWATHLVRTERDHLQLSMLRDEALFQVEQLIVELPDTIMPSPTCHQTPCVLAIHSPNFFLEQDSASFITHKGVVVFPLSAHIHNHVILEHLYKNVLESQTEDYFRATFLLQDDDNQAQLRMQATWKKTTLKGDIVKTLALRLAFRE